MNQPQDFAGAEFIGFLSALELAAVPDPVQAEARRLLLDQMGCIISARATEIAPVVEAGAAAIWPGGGPVATAYRLARLGDAMDFDDGAAGAHFGCGAVAAALALADMAQATGADLLAAIIAGFEAGGRIGQATGPYYDTVDGVQRFLPVWGISTPVVYAAAMAAARLLRLPQGQAMQALSLAGAFAPIPVGAKWSSMLDLPNTKYCDTGWATVAGVSAVLLARSGTTGLTNLLEDGGLFTMLSARHAAPGELTRGLGQDWALSGIRYKEWPCCGMLIGALRAAQPLVGNTPADRIGAITAWVPENTTLPRFVNPDPRTFASLQFSLPHAMAMLLSGVESGPLWLDAGLAARPDIAALRQRVTVLRLTADHRAAGIAAQVMMQVDGQARTATTPVTVTSGARPPCDDAGIAAKFRSLVAEPWASGLERLVAALPGGAPADLLSTLTEARPR